MIFFLSVEGLGFVFNLVVTKVIRKHNFFFTLFYFFDDNLINKRKILSFYSIKIKWRNVTPIQYCKRVTFCDVSFLAPLAVESLRQIQYTTNLHL